MSKKMDLSYFRELLYSSDLRDLRKDLTIFDNQPCTFYYDESNNFRKLSLKDTDFNAPIDSDFVLGGVMHFGEKSSADITALIKGLNLQKTTKELKRKYLGETSTFLECLNSNKVICFLEWLIDSDLYVHCFNVNNLYYAIVDIVDSINDERYIPFSLGMKDALYRLALYHHEDFYELLIKCNYPNLSAENISVFYNRLLEYIDEEGVHLSFDSEVLKQGLKVARKQKECVFLNGNDERTILKDYSSFYIRPLGVFAHSNHVFDHECLIEDILNKYDFYLGDTQIKNYSFVDSMSNPLIQVSDCVVGLLGKYYTYVNAISYLPLSKVFETYTDKQKNTLKLFSKLFYKSESVSKLLFNACESREEHATSSAIIDNFFESKD